MDYPRQVRLKIYATVVRSWRQSITRTLAQVTPANYRARIERLLLFICRRLTGTARSINTPPARSRWREYSQNLQQTAHDPGAGESAPAAAQPVEESATTEQRPPLPPFTRDSAIQKVRAAEDGWNSRDAEKVARLHRG